VCKCSYSPLKVGSVAQLTKVFSDSDVRSFADLTGDRNPLHLDEDYAVHSRFGGRIVHGMLPVGLISAVLGTLLPGPGTIYLSQEVSFVAPIFVGERVTASVQVIEIAATGSNIRLRTCCIKENGTLAVDGVAVVKAP